MPRKPFRFTGESYETDRSGGFRLRRRMILERFPGDARRYRVVKNHVEMPPEKQRERDGNRLNRLAGILSGRR